jgi:peptidoglycan/LPS O-acetylase OafA/YrhL
MDRIMEKLGDASYCTYLFGSLGTLLVWVVAKPMPHNPAFAVMAIVFSAIFANVIGYAVHRGVERRTTAVLLQFAGRDRPTVPIAV